MVYFIVSKQILYVLHTQLANLPESRKRAYGIGSVSYSIAGTSLSFRFWLKGKRATDSPEDANTITLVLTESADGGEMQRMRRRRVRSGEITSRQMTRC